MDMSMVSTGTVFPLTFALTQAFNRRERATILVANLKASVVALYYMHRDWDQTRGYPAGLGDDTKDGAIAAKRVLVDLLVNVRKFLTATTTFESLAEARLTASRNEFLQMFEHEIHLDESDRLFRSAVKSLIKEDDSRQYLKECYKQFSKLSVLNERLTLNAGYTRGGEGGLSRTNQYLRYMIENVEELRGIKEYRTPTMMRHACGVLFHLFAVLLAPYFVHFCDTWEATGHSETTCVAGYGCATFYVTIVMLLYHVQQDLENPFDESGLDDVFFTCVEELDDLAGERLMRSNASSFTDAARFGFSSSPKASYHMDVGGVALGGSHPMGMGMSRRPSQDAHHLERIPSGALLADKGSGHKAASQQQQQSGGGGGGGSGGPHHMRPSSSAVDTRSSSTQLQMSLFRSGSSNLQQQRGADLVRGGSSDGGCEITPKGGSSSSGSVRGSSPPPRT